MVDNLLAALYPHPLWALALFVVGAAAAPLLVRYSASRTLTRPLAFALEDETTLLAAVLADLRRYPYVATLTAADFAANHHHNIWAALRAALGDRAEVPAEVTEDDCAALGAVLAGEADTVLAQARANLARSSQPTTDINRFDELLALATERGYTPDGDSDSEADSDADSDAADAACVAAAENVLAAGNDRNRLSGTGLVVPAADPNSLDPDAPPFVRAYTAPTRRKHAIVAAVVGAVTSLLPGWIAALHTPNPVATAAVAAVVAALVISSVIISLVDLDTLYIDTPVWAIGTAAGWAAAIVAAVAAGTPKHLLVGLALVVAVAVLFEGTNLVFRLLRGHDGQGFGDTLIIISTVGLPPALTGDYRAGYWSVMGGLIAGCIGWACFRAAGKVTRHTPFAFGPWLSIGWVVALSWYTLDSTFLLSMA